MILFLSISNIGSAQLADGEIQVVEGEVELIRSGKVQILDPSVYKLQNKDILKTKTDGKARITLQGGDEILMATNTEVQFSEKILTKGFVRIRNRAIKVTGKILATIKKNKTTPIKIRTPSAIIGIKGTQFVVEHQKNITTTGTIEGVVLLTSLVNQNSIELKAGTMSSVNLAGEIMPIQEFSGELLKEFEFAGETLEESQAAGQKINLN